MIRSGDMVLVVEVEECRGRGCVAGCRGLKRKSGVWPRYCGEVEDEERTERELPCREEHTLLPISSVVVSCVQDNGDVGGGVGEVWYCRDSTRMAKVMR